MVLRLISIAVMTRRWARFRWPALAARHASPWRRKISATSSFGRTMSGSRQVGDVNSPSSSGIDQFRLVKGVPYRITRAGCFFRA
jgi:hypothetical protein